MINPENSTLAGASHSADSICASRIGDIDILIGDFTLTRFHRLPEFIVDNPEFGNIADDPPWFRVHA
jgi:hypothetical protein